MPEAKTATLKIENLLAATTDKTLEDRLSDNDLDLDTNDLRDAAWEPATDKAVSADLLRLPNTYFFQAEIYGQMYVLRVEVRGNEYVVVWIGDEEDAAGLTA